MVPMPHTVSSVRGNFNKTTNKREADTTPLTNEPCLISPGKSPIEATFMGPAELDSGILFIAADADIQQGDKLTNDATGDKWIVAEHPVSFDIPVDFESGADHKQITIRRDPAQ